VEYCQQLYVVLDTPKDGKPELNWIGTKNDAEYRYTSEPASWSKRLEATMMYWVMPQELL